jgi:hypothetical protein
MVTFDDARNAFVVKIDIRVNGKRIRSREILPVGATLEEAEGYEQKLLGRSPANPMSKLAEKLGALLSDEKDPGFIYAVSNSAFPNLIKIGMTKRSVESRLSEMGTGTPGEWRIIARAYLSHALGAEKLLHNHFSEFRVNDRREFFDVLPFTAQKAIRECAKILPATESIEAEYDRYASNVSFDMRIV